MKTSLNDTLREHGVPVKYKMANPFKPVYGPFRVHFFPQAASTNDLAREGRFSHGDIIVADAQTAGRGQRDNGWESAPGENLTLSVVLAPAFLPAAGQFLLSQAVSLATSDTLARLGIAASVKWPNDIYIGSRKVAGILIENDVMGSNLSRSVAGVGLNVNQAAFHPSLPNPVSMHQATGKIFDRELVLEQFCECLAARYRQIETGLANVIESGYLERLYLLNIPHTFTLPDSSRFEGTIRGIGPGGELMVETRGKMRSFLFKEISF